MKNSFFFFISVLISLSACTPKQAPSTKSGLRSRAFEKTIEGKKNHLYVVANSNGLELAVTNLGAKVVSLVVPDKNGSFDDIVLGFDNIDDYDQPKSAYLGAVIGRYAGRISKGKFSINGTQYTLPTNNGNNSAHGGTKGFNAVMWDIEPLGAQRLKCTYISEDGEMGYPGTVTVSMLYELTDANEFKISYTATTNKSTHINLTHHSFFNLKGEGYPTVNAHEVYINADYYTAYDDEMIPTGEIAPINGTALDFTSPRKIGDRIDAAFPPLQKAKGYDHNYVLNKTKQGVPELAASVYEATTGRFMEVFTTEPGIQFYTANFLDGSLKGKKDTPYVSRCAFCLEAQHFADSPNKSNFPSTLLQPGETYQQTCIYKFSVR